METLSYLFYITNLPHVRKENKKKKNKTKQKTKNKKTKTKNLTFLYYSLGKNQKNIG